MLSIVLKRKVWKRWWNLWNFKKGGREEQNFSFFFCVNFCCQKKKVMRHVVSAWQMYNGNIKISCLKRIICGSWQTRIGGGSSCCCFYYYFYYYYNYYYYYYYWFARMRVGEWGIRWQFKDTDVFLTVWSSQGRIYICIYIFCSEERAGENSYRNTLRRPGKEPCKKLDRLYITTMAREREEMTIVVCRWRLSFSAVLFFLLLISVACLSWPHLIFYAIILFFYIVSYYITSYHTTLFPLTLYSTI